MHNYSALTNSHIDIDFIVYYTGESEFIPKYNAPNVMFRRISVEEVALRIAKVVSKAAGYPLEGG